LPLGLLAYFTESRAEQGGGNVPNNDTKGPSVQNLGTPKIRQGKNEKRGKGGTEGSFLRKGGKKWVTDKGENRTLGEMFRQGLG